MTQRESSIAAADSEEKKTSERRLALKPDVAVAIRTALDSMRGDSADAVIRRRALLSALDTWRDGELSTASAVVRLARRLGAKA